MAVTVLVAYDISNDDRRAKVSATLQAWGDRIQRSVFLCLVEPDDIAELITRLDDLIQPTTDLLHVFPLCAACGKRAEVRGQAMLTEPPKFWIV